MGQRQKKKQQKRAAIIEGAIKVGATNTYDNIPLVSREALRREVKQADRICWGLTNMIVALQCINENAIDSILDTFRKYGYNGDRISQIVSSIRKVKFANNELIKTISPCYKDELLQPITVGNLMDILENVIALTIGIGSDGVEYREGKFELAAIPKALVPAIKLAPGCGEIEWISEKVTAMCKEGNEYLDKHDLKGDDVDIRIGKAIKAQKKLDKEKQ